MIRFHYEPADAAAMDGWGAYNAPLTQGQFFVLYIGAVGAAVAFALANPQYNGLVVIGGAVVAFTLSILAVGAAIRSRHAVVAGCVPGAQSLHFSRAGIHHVSPAGDYRYSWRQLAGVEILLGYVVFRFRGHGALPVPVRALEDFGQSYDEEFLRQLTTLIQAGVPGEE